MNLGTRNTIRSKLSACAALRLTEKQMDLNALVSSVLGAEKVGEYSSEWVHAALFEEGPIERSDRWAEIYRLCNEVRKLEAELEA